MVNRLEQYPEWMIKGLPQPTKVVVCAERVYVGLDGDETGKKVEEALLTDDPDIAQKVSQGIQDAHKEIRDTVKRINGKVVFDGGDNMLLYMPFEKEVLQSFIDTYQQHTGNTCTVGVGKRPIEAHYSLVYGKNTGKAKVVVYSEEIKEELDKIREEQKDLEQVKEKLKYKAQQDTFDLKAFEIIKGALNELNITITDDKVYDIFYRLVEVNNLNTFEEMEQFFGKPREELKTDIRNMYESQKTGGLCVWLRQGGVNDHLQPSFPGQSVIPGGKKQRSPHRRTDYLTIEDYNRDQVNYKDTDIQYNSGNQTKDSQDMSMGGEPGDAIYIP